MTTEKLISGLRYCDARWETAICHPEYRDEPTEDKPFTEENHRRYWWADQWRLLFHEFENALYRQPDVRAGMIEGLTTREPLTIYDS